jgi:phosphoribosylglycinamide formyltransferase-1
MLRIAVLLSGRGSNLQALIDAIASDDFPATIVCAISNVPDAQGLARAHAADIETIAISHRDYPDRETFDTALNDALRQREIELVCLAGFMRILTPGFVNSWRNRMINIHPSLLPSFKGLDAQQQALDAGVKLSGCTVHFVRPGMDEGPIIAQAAVPVLDEDDADSLARRILAQEHVIYPTVVRMIAEGRIEIDGAHVNLGINGNGIATLCSVPPNDL